jgi:hypothetical protein
VAMLFSGSLQGWFAQVGAAELQATANFPAAVFSNLHSSNDHSLKLCMACRYSRVSMPSILCLLGHVFTP